MISKSDLILILTEMEESLNLDTSEMISKTLVAKTLPLDVLKYINDTRELEVNKFYTHLRKSYN